jgi:1-acyl-sn-glycerol-3-phosphate acyltransferase
LENLKGLRPPFLIAANHASHLDTPAILMALPPRLRRRTLVAAASDYFFDAPWKGVLVALALGAIAVERRRATRQSLRTLRGLLAEGWNIIVFPEGGRSPDGQLRGGKRGVAHLAVAAGVPVLPVGVLGTFTAMPSGSPWPKRGHFEVHFGLPLMPTHLDSADSGAARMRTVTEGIMTSIEGLTGQEISVDPPAPPSPVPTLATRPAWHWY